MNIAKPERAAIEHFWDRLVVGAPVIFDDYGWLAARELPDSSKPHRRALPGAAFDLRAQHALAHDSIANERFGFERRQADEKKQDQR
jgi:hypothetical protein